jgi:hypothetical protein
MNHKEKPEIAFLGIGLMGLPMVCNLLKQESGRKLIPLKEVYSDKRFLKMVNEK